MRLDDPGGSMEHVIVKDQVNFGICYAAAASSYVDAYLTVHKGLLTNKIDHTSSFIELALGTNQLKKSPDAYDGGEICSVLDYVADNGFCDNTNIIEKLTNKNLDELFSMLQFYYDSNRKVDLEDQVLSQSFASNVQSCMKSFGVEPALTPSIKSILGSLAATTSMGFLKDIVSYQCTSESRIKVKDDIRCPKMDFDLERKIISSIDDTKNWINDHLDNATPKLPIPISFCSEVLYSGNSYHSKNADQVIRSDCGAHAVLIIGRRKNPTTGTCQYLLRNSWGTSCNNPFSTDVECEQGKGNIWIDANSLASNITGLGVKTKVPMLLPPAPPFSKGK
jgi:hypothetical protein